MDARGTANPRPAHPGPAFPFTIAGGQVRPAGADEALRGRIVQVLFTAPGERIDLPEFGCGLFNLVFEPNDELLRAALGFSIVQSLTRWLGDEIAVDGVDVARDGESVVVEVAYTRLADRSRAGVRVQFQEGPVWNSG
ncbi:MAG: GPW/gp25 family protein [Pseudonocardiaceae bacterium]